MATINFTKFKEKLISGEKKTTIRRLDLNRIDQMKKNGIQVYWMLRTHQTEKLFDAKLVGVRVIQFDCVGYPTREAVGVDFSQPFPPEGYTTKRIYGVESLAREDGFNNSDEMAKFFRETYGDKDALCGVDSFGLPIYFMLIRFDKV